MPNQSQSDAVKVDAAATLSRLLAVHADERTCRKWSAGEIHAVQQAIILLRSTTAAKAYADKNPLGGPARMFEAMAERIRAGEDYYAVLADYGLAHVPNGGSAKVPEGWKLVPVEPTPEMFGAGYLTANKVKRAVGLGHCDHIMTDSLCVAIYRAMLAAARTSQEGAEGPGPGECNDFLGKPGHYRGDRK